MNNQRHDVPSDGDPSKLTLERGTVDLHIQRHARANLERSDNTLRVGSFLLHIDPASPHRFLNYAVPDDGTEPSAADIAELTAAFTERGLTPRLEFIPSSSPKAEGAFGEAGFAVESRMPLMACAPGEVVVPEHDGVSVEFTDDVDKLRAGLVVQFAAFAEPEPPTDADMEARMLAPARRGAVTAIATIADGTVVGAGRYTAPIDGTCEVVGIAVEPSHQGRGIGAVLTARVTSAAHDAGVTTAWLEPSGQTALRLYERVGYRAVGEKLAMAKESADSGNGSPLA